MLSLVLVPVTMLALSRRITLIALTSLPMQWVGKRLQRVTREQVVIDASMSSLPTERFGVAGATLAELYGRVAGRPRRISPGGPPIAPRVSSTLRHRRPRLSNN